MKNDPDMQAAKKRDAYERAEGLPLKFHAWGLVLDRIKAAPKKPPIRGLEHDGFWIDDAAFGGNRGR